MKKSQTLAVALIIGLVFSLSPSVRAEMGHHQAEGSHGKHGEHDQGHDQHAGMDDHAMGTDAIMDNYLAIQSALAGDSMEGVSEKAKALAEATGGLHAEAMKGDQHLHGAGTHVLMKAIVGSAGKLAAKKDIDSAREEFGILSEKMIAYQKQLGDEGNKDAQAFVCDMAKKSWLQEGDAARNPYYGSKMLKCGRKIQ